jgi:CheY-like chemotaxis protein
MALDCNYKHEIIIVEDFHQSSSFISSTLRFCRSANCTVCTTAEDALAVLEKREDRFDVIMTDVMLPGMNGIELIRSIRMLEQSKQWKSNLIIAMSVDTSYETAAMAAGASFFLDKHMSPMKKLFDILDSSQPRRFSF